MQKILTVKGLCKDYPKFRLQDVSFSIAPGSIMGFIGRNGAGKTTTLKALTNLIHPTAGEITYFGLPLSGNEAAIKQRIGYASGGINYYPRKKLKDILAITRNFYENWDDELCRRYLDLFTLDEDKRPMELSEGMKVKVNLAIALSHHAELVILDEPTSGLDPVSREELLDIFLSLVEQGTSILFSTHITSDLDKCADHITYIQKGKILASLPTEDFIDSYRLVRLSGTPNDTEKPAILGLCRDRTGGTALIHRESAPLFSPEAISLPDLETIMVHLEKEAME